MGHSPYRPLRQLLIEVAERYGRPILISETGAEGGNAAGWLRYVSGEVRSARRRVLGNMGLVRAYGARLRERDELRRMMRAEGAAHGASWLFLERLRCWHDVAFWLANAAVLTTAVVQWQQGHISTGGVVVATTLTLRILAGSREMALSLLGLSQQFGAVTQAVEVLWMPGADQGAQASQPNAREAAASRAPRGTVELQQIRFAPDSGSLLFDGLDLHIPAGQRVGIVGPSGAGKSTLLRLIQDISAPQQGRVLLGGQ